MSFPLSRQDWKRRRPRTSFRGKEWLRSAPFIFRRAGKRAMARHHLVLGEFFAMQMLIAARRAETAAAPGKAHCGSGALLEKFLKLLPFELTAAQQKVIAEIRRDLCRIIR